MSEIDLPKPIRPTHQATRRAFTLVELLVVIGIIVVIAGIALPLVMRANRGARNARIAADLQTISAALDAFKNDHGAYPEVGAPNVGFGYLAKNLYGALGDGVTGTGTPPPADPNDPPAYLGTTSYNPGDVVQNSGSQFVAIRESIGKATSDPLYWIEFDPTGTPATTLLDGADGPGMRMRAGGKKYGPYLAEGALTARRGALVDVTGNPILYFPASPAKPNIALPGGYLTDTGASTFTNDNASRYDPADNWIMFKHLNDPTDSEALFRIHAVLGDYNPNGGIDTTAGERSFDQPYLLWSAGADGLYGPITITDGSGTGAASNFQINRKQADACDDVTNFR